MEISFLPDHSIEVKQSGYIKKLLDTVEYDQTHPTPSTSNFFNTSDEPTIDYSADSKRFKSLLMSIMFLAIRTRPDILKEVIHLSSFSNNPGPVSFAKLYRVIGYLKSTINLGIRFKVDNPQLTVYADASYCTHLNGKSHSGIFITLGENGGPIYVKSQQQSLVATSSTEAEILSVSTAVQRVLPFKTIMSELGFTMRDPIQVFQDNKSCIKIIQDGQGSSGKRKLFRVRYGFLHDYLRIIPSLYLTAEHIA
jgi:hypothetical protein